MCAAAGPQQWGLKQASCFALVLTKESHLASPGRAAPTAAPTAVPEVPRPGRHFLAWTASPLLSLRPQLRPLGLGACIPTPLPSWDDSEDLGCPGQSVWPACVGGSTAGWRPPSLPALETCHPLQKKPSALSPPLWSASGGPSAPGPELTGSLQPQP